MAAGMINLQKASGGVTKISGIDGTGTTQVMLPESGNIVSVDTAVTDNAIARYDGTTGKLQNSGVIIDDSGNVGINTPISAWRSTSKVIELGNIGAVHSIDNNAFRLQYNSYINGSGQWIYRQPLGASLYEQYNGTHNWHVAPDGAAGSVITFKGAMTLDTSGNLLLTSGTGALGYGTGAGGIVTQLTSKSTPVTLNKPSGLIVMHNQTMSSNSIVSFVVYNNTVTANSVIVLNLSGGISSAQQYTCYVDDLNDGWFQVSLKNIYPTALTHNVEITFAVIKGSNA